MSRPPNTATTKSRTAKGRQRKRNEARTLLMIGIPIVIVGIALVALYNRGQSNVSVDNTRLVLSDSPTRGPADAPVTLVEFLDPECEACRAAYPEIEEILSDYEGQLRYIVRYFPNHSNSVLAIAATEAAGEQGMYWEMQEILFANQPEWGEQSAPQTDLMMRYATELGLDVERFTASLQSPAYIEKAERDRQDALALGVRGTPTFYVNGQTVYGMDGQALRDLIDAALQR